MKHALLTCTLLASGLAAQGTPSPGPFANGDYLFLCGYSRTGGPPATGDSFPVSRFKDLDGDGMISDSNELFAFLPVSFNVRNGTGSFMTDMDWVHEGDTYAFYFSDSADGRIVRGVDVNNDGVLDATEVTEFFDFQSGYAPNGIAAYHDRATGQTRIYVAQDDSSSPYGRGIHRLVDLNGDGDATDSGEQSLFVGATSNLTVPGRSGPVSLVSHYWDRVHTLDDGSVIAYSPGSSSATTPNNPDQFCWYVFADNNGQATASVFFNPSRLNDIATYADFDVGGAFPQWDVSVTSGTTTKGYADVQYFAQQAGSNDYYFGAGYNTGWVNVNPQGVNVHGLFYRWRDANQDLSVDAGEVSLFANFSNAPIAGLNPFTVTSSSSSFVEMSDRIFSLKATDAQLHVCWGIGSSGPNKGWMLLEDLNSDGTIAPTGEARMSYEYSNAGAAIYSALYGPYIKGASAFDRGFMPGPFVTGLAPYGQGCPHPQNDLSPVCDAFGGVPSVGNQAFGLAVYRMPPSAAVYLFIGFGRTSQPIPPPFGLPGCNLLTNPILGLGAFTAAQDGIATLSLPIPNSSSLVGSVMSTQWSTIATVGSAGYLIMSNALEVTIQ